MYYGFIYNCDFDSLKRYLFLASEDEAKMILSDIKVKSKIINNYYEFVYFIQDMPDNLCAYLLDTTGLELLILSERKKDMLNAILTSDKLFVAGLFDNLSFCKEVYTFLKNEKFVINNLNMDCILKFLIYYKKCDKMEEFLFEIYPYLTSNLQFYIIRNLSISFGILKKIIINSKKDVAQYIIDNDVRIGSINFEYDDLLNLSEKGISFNKLFFLNRRYINISKIINPNIYRDLMNKMSNNTDISDIENARCKYVNNIINNFKDDSILKELNDLYVLLENNEIIDDKVLKSIFCYTPISYIYNLIHSKQLTYDNLKDFLIKESRYIVSRMVLDYHFKSFSVNIIKDIVEILNFNKSLKILDDETIFLYERVKNIDNLGNDDLINLFNDLKKYDMVEKFYDDVRNCKNKAYNLFREKNISRSNKELINEDLSELYGVCIYELCGQDFFALVKSGVDVTKNNIRSDGGCFSFIGNNCLDTFEHPNEEINIVYENFDIDYIMHVSPNDSFSLSKRDNFEILTPNINKIMTPNDFLSSSPFYNKIIMSYGKYLGEDDKIKLPTPGFILCYDEINYIHTIVANKSGLPILLVKTNKYNPIKKDNLMPFFISKENNSEYFYKYNIDNIEYSRHR